jgi:hypothetical protein
MPGAIEIIYFFFAETIDFELYQCFFEHLSMQIVELGPRYPAVSDTIHVRAVNRPPSIGESRPIDIQAFTFAELLALGDHAGAPVNDGAEDIESENFYVFWNVHHSMHYPHTGNLKG